MVGSHGASPCAATGLMVIGAEIAASRVVKCGGRAACIHDLTNRQELQVTPCSHQHRNIDYLNYSTGHDRPPIVL
jgi:hypothetical protein